MKGSSFGVIYDAFDGLFAFGLFAIHSFTFRSFAIRSFTFVLSLCSFAVHSPQFLCSSFVRSFVRSPCICSPFVRSPFVHVHSPFVRFRLPLLPLVHSFAVRSFAMFVCLIRSQFIRSSSFIFRSFVCRSFARIHSSFAVRSCLFAVLHRVCLPLYVCLLFVHSPLLAAALSSRDSHSVHRTSGTHGTTVLKVEPKYTRPRDVLKYLVILNFSQVFGGSKKVRT
jgi:hypothetical protein